MRAWLKGGLIGITIFIVFILISILSGFATSDTFVKSVYFLAKPMSFIMPNYTGSAFLFVIPLIETFIIFLIGAFIGWIIGKIKSHA